LPDSKLNKLNMINILESAAREAGTILLSYYQKELRIEHKDDAHQIVTEADKVCEKAIENHILREMKKKGIPVDQIGFIGEEGLHKSGTYTFIIDPLDGTSNFAAGIDYFCVSIGLAKNSELIAGVIYDPVRDTMFLAEQGKGANMISSTQTKKLHIQHAPLAHSLAVMGFYPKKSSLTQWFTIAQDLVPLTHNVRWLGAFELDLCYVALNRFSFVIGKPFIWDFAAGYCIVKESGGTVVDWDNKEIVLDFSDPQKGYPILACHPKNKSVILPFLYNNF